MLTIEYVVNLVKRHQEKAADHIERLKARLEMEDGEVGGWVYDEDVALYWSHSEVLYLSLNSFDFINYYLKSVRAVDLIGDLYEITKAGRDRLQCLYFQHVSSCWKRQGVTRSNVPEGFASEEFLDMVFKI